MTGIFSPLQYAREDGDGGSGEKEEEEEDDDDDVDNAERRRGWRGLC